MYRTGEYIQTAKNSFPINLGKSFVFIKDFHIRPFLLEVLPLEALLPDMGPVPLDMALLHRIHQAALLDKVLPPDKDHLVLHRSLPLRTFLLRSVPPN